MIQVSWGASPVFVVCASAGTIVGLVANGYSTNDILKAYPYLQPDDIRQALIYVAWRVEEMEIPIELA